jgi:hypothetical protein
MAALRASETAFWSPYTAQIHARSVARTPFQTVSGWNSQKLASAKEPQAVLCLDAIPKIQNSLRSAFTLCWAMVAERCASSGWVHR